MSTNAVMKTKVSALVIHRMWNTIQATEKSEKYRMIRDAEARIMRIGSRNRQNQNSEKLTLPSRCVRSGGTKGACTAW